MSQNPPLAYLPDDEASGSRPEVRHETLGKRESEEEGGGRYRPCRQSSGQNRNGNQGIPVLRRDRTGCTRFQVFTKIILRLSYPSIFATGLFAFMLSYSEFLFSMILGGEAKNRMLSVVMAALARNTDVSWGLLNSGIFLAIVPSLVVVVIVWRFVVEGIIVGGTKA